MRFVVLGSGAASAGVAGAPPDLGILPRSLRRGLSTGMKLAIAAAGQAVAQARASGRAAGELPIVYGSAVGETETAIELLTSITATRESSPVLFRHSVHNAAAGLLSIALGSQASSTAVAAGAETLLAVLLEAQGLLSEGTAAVLLVVAEEGASALLSPGRIAPGGALAWVLAPLAAIAGEEAVGEVYLTAPEWRGGGGGELPRPAGDPLAPAWQLAAAIAAARAHVDAAPVAVALSAEERWQVRIAGRAEALS